MVVALMNLVAPAIILESSTAFVFHVVRGPPLLVAASQRGASATSAFQIFCSFDCVFAAPRLSCCFAVIPSLLLG